jgi:hypothetical protein
VHGAKHVRSPNAEIQAAGIVDTMPPFLNAGDVLQDRYEITDILGSATGVAAYLATERTTKEALLLWESAELFALSTRPPGAREYLNVGGLHYLVIHLEGRPLGLMLVAAGRLRAKWAAQWLAEMYTDVGYWHNRQPAPLICLRRGPISLSAWRLTEDAHAMIPFYRDVNQPAAVLTPVDEYCFSAPEQVPEELSPQSDVYALGALFYCLLSGQLPPEPAALEASGALQVSLRSLVPDLPPELEQIVIKAMQLDPHRRYPTAAEMANDLKRFLDKGRAGEPKGSMLKRLYPFFIGVIVFGVLFLAVNLLLPDKWRILHSGAKERSSPIVVSLPAPAFTDTPVPTPLPATAEIPTPAPTYKVVVNQVRLDQFPQIAAYVTVLDGDQEPLSGLGRAQFRIWQDRSSLAHQWLRYSQSG